MAITIRFPDIDNAAELLNAGMYGAGAVIEIQSATTEAGAYSALSGTGSTPTIALVSGTRLYTGYDPAGTSTTWYRARFRSSDSVRFSVDWTGDTLWATRPGHAPFQVADEFAGLLCSLEDVTQRMFGSGTVSNVDQATILDLIREVSADIEGFTGRWLAPRPIATRLFDTTYGRRVAIPKGIRDVTAVGYATSNQPTTGGTYTTIATTDWREYPTSAERDPGWPALGIEVYTTYLVPAWNGLSVTSAAGFASVPYDIQSVAIGAVTRRFFGKERAEPLALVGPEGGVRILRDIGPDGTRTLQRYARLVAA